MLGGRFAIYKNWEAQLEADSLQSCYTTKTFLPLTLHFGPLRRRKSTVTSTVMRSIWISFSLPVLLSIVSAASNVPRVSELHTRRDSTNSTLRSFTSKLQSNAYGTTFAVNVTLGGDQTFPLLVDTGSSDLWVVQEDWICVNDTSNAVVPRGECGLGSEIYHLDSTFQQVQGEFYGEIMGNGRQSGILDFCTPWVCPEPVQRHLRL
jgi:hypothetical protein